MNRLNKMPVQYKCSRRFVPLMIVAACLGSGIFYSSVVQAQETHQDQESRKAVRLSPDQLKALEGVFQSSQNKEMYVQFSAAENALVAKLLWNGNEIRIIPESDSGFVSAEPIEGRPLPVRFMRDKEGSFSQLTVGNNDLWIKVKDYKPVVKKEIKHEPEQLRVFEGLYELQENKGTFIQITEKENKLILKQYWDGNEIPFVPDSASHFFCKDQLLFTLQFIKDNSGNFTQMLAFGRDHWNKAKKPQFTPKGLKAFEGKYQFKEDKDNLILITARGSNLVVKQLWDGKEIIVAARSDSFFYCDDQSYSLNFTKDKDGGFSQVMVLNTDLFERVKE